MIKVILIDDEKDVAELAGEFLLLSGDIAVDTVCSPREGLSKCCQAGAPYDVIISDYQMPGMNGIELLRQLRARGVLSPFILFTGRGREEVVIDALNSGADLYLQKGGAPEAQFGELANAVRQLHMRRTAERDLRRSRDELAILFDASSRLVGESDMGKIYEVISDAALGLMNADALVVSSYDGEERMIQCAFCWNEGVRVDVSRFPLIPLEDEGKGVQSQVIRSGRSMLIEDYQELLKRTEALFYFNEEGRILTREEAEKVPEQDMTRSSIVVPLKYQGDVIGVVQVHSNRLANFTAHDLKLIESLAGHAASAIAVAKYQEAEGHEAERREFMERRLRILEAVMDGSEEIIMIWIVRPGGIYSLSFNKRAEGTALNQEGLCQMTLDIILRDHSGASLENTFKEALRSAQEVVSLQGTVRMKDESWMPFLLRIHPVGDEHVVVYAKE